MWRLAGRASISDIHLQGVLSFLFRQRWRELRRPRCLGNMNSWRTFFRRPSFVVQTKILFCETTITLKISFWCQKLSQFVRKIVSQNKAKNAGRSGKNAGMREIRQNAGFPARLREGWHLWPPMTKDGKVKQRQHFYNHGDIICYPESGYVTTKLHGTSTCRCNNNAIFSDRAIFKFPAVYVCRPR